MKNKDKKKKKRHIFSDIVLLIALICFCYSAYRLAKYAYETYLTNKTRSEVAAMIRDDTPQEETEDERAAMMAKYGDIYAKNKDFIGWLKVEGTGIDNPVMYTPDDGLNGQFYLRKNFYKEYDIGGTLFVDYRCVLDPDKGVSTNTIIYGHRMRNETMFGPLKHFKDVDFCESHKKITFDTLYRPGNYVLFCSFLSQASDNNPEVFKYYDFINASSEKELNEFLDNIKPTAIYYDEENAPSYGDEILTLSTCDYYKTDGRLALLAKRVK